MDSGTLGDIGTSIIGIVIVILAVTVVAWPVLRGREWLLRRATNRFEELATQFNLSSVQREGFVLVHFPVYVGMLVTVTELSPQLWVPPQSARPVVNSLALLSFKYGLFTILAPYVLFMVLLNYVLHLRRFIGS